MQTKGIHLDQAPPLSIPLSFFLTAPLAVATAGALMLWNGWLLFLSHWHPLTLALTHLCTLGFLTMVMMGALYQMTPVVAGSPVGRVRLGHAVYVLWVGGVITLCWGLARVQPDVVYWAIVVLTLALLLFVIPLGTALLKAPSFDETVLGMCIAVAALLVAGIFGLWMAHGYGGMGFPGPRPLWLQVHLSVALLGWVGGADHRRLVAGDSHVLSRRAPESRNEADDAGLVGGRRVDPLRWFSPPVTSGFWETTVNGRPGSPHWARSRR